MNKQSYKQYLLSDHWKSFRQEIIKIRKTCQNCGCKNKKLNIHHKHYNSLENEKNEDVIVLCEDCHKSKHKKTRWKNKLKNGKLLDFTGASQKSKELYYSKETNIKRICNRCGELHSLFYMNYGGNRTSLAMSCPNSKPRTQFLKMEFGLDIPIFQRGKNGEKRIINLDIKEFKPKIKEKPALNSLCNKCNTGKLIIKDVKNKQVYSAYYYCENCNTMYFSEEFKLCKINILSREDYISLKPKEYL